MDLLHLLPKRAGWQEDLAQETDVFDEYVGRTMVSSITVQVVLQRPDQHATTVYWVLNREESDSNVPDFPTPKPRGWGNPGGGLELVDAFSRSDQLHSFEGMILACARREVTAETGFIYLQFEPDFATRRFPLLRNVHRSGHRIFTLSARLNNFEQRFTEEGEVEEANEIERGLWFDLSKSPVDLLAEEPDLPYWSHVWRTVTVLNRLAQNRGKSVPPIHPLWKLVFRVGAGDPRFPADGYCLEPRAWYVELRHLVDIRATRINFDRIFDLYREEIEVQRAIEAERRPVAPPVRDIRDSIQQPQCIATSEDLRLLAEYRAKIAREEEEWREFMSAP